MTRHLHPAIRTTLPMIVAIIDYLVTVTLFCIVALLCLGPIIVILEGLTIVGCYRLLLAARRWLVVTRKTVARVRLMSIMRARTTPDIVAASQT